MSQSLTMDVTPQRWLGRERYALGFTGLDCVWQRGDTTGCVLYALEGEAYSPFGEGVGGREGIRTVCLFAFELTRDMEFGTRCTEQWQRTDAALFEKVGESILRWHVCGGRKTRWTVVVHKCLYCCWLPKLVSQSETPQIIVSPTVIWPS